MPRAVLSVSEKSGIIDFGRALVELGWEIVSTGGTAKVLKGAGVPVSPVSQITEHPEIMGGRVKTLHPAVHAGLLARRDDQDDMQSLQQHGYSPIDLVAVNLYPFGDAVAAGALLAEAMEQVDIGGPTMLRAAAKNHAFVLAVVDPLDYAAVIEALRQGAVDSAMRTKLAAKVFAHTAAYDAAITEYLAGQGQGDPASTEAFPLHLNLSLRKVQDLRYGENPDQPAAFYADLPEQESSLAGLRQLHGKELSFNNLLDIDAALFAVSAWSDAPEAACVIVKHTTPCGIALAPTVEDAFGRARESDPVSAFGGVVAFNRTLTAEAAESIADAFLEVLIAPAFEPAAISALSRRKNLRLIEQLLDPGVAGELDYKRVRGGFVVQHRLQMMFPETDWKIVTRREPSEEEWRDLRFAWRVVAAVKSNAIVLAREEQTVGIGAGQMSRVDSARIAVLKAEDQRFDRERVVMASDAFFPFRDGVDAAAKGGVTAIIQPGGSVRDEEVIAAAESHDIAMAFTGRRVFRH